MSRMRKCLRVGCDNLVPQSEGRGRPQLYCRHACKIAAYRRRHRNVMLQSAGMGGRKYNTNAERQAAYRERVLQREYDERRARAKVYAATLGDALGWDEERVEEALVRVASREDGLVAVELALQAFARRSR